MTAPPLHEHILTLGRGGMGEVTLAVQQGASGFTRLQVVKRLRPELTVNQDFVAMFLQEARLAARLSHPNIVQTNEVGHDGETYYISMEYLEGRTLASILQRARRTSTDRHSSSGPVEFPLAMHLRVIADTLDGLHFAHELRGENDVPLALIHRDVSPVNIFITYDGTIKVLDFGIAKAADADAHTRTGVIKGKVAYMAPEQFVAKPALDRRCDIYAVGVMLWEAATGRRLWSGQSDLDVVKHLTLRQAPPAPIDVNPAVPPKLNEICRRAMAFQPNERYPTAAALQTDVEALLDDMGGMSSRAVGQFFARVFEADRAKVKELTERKLRELRQRAGLTSSIAPRATASPLSRSSISTSSVSDSHPNSSTPVSRSLDSSSTGRHPNAESIVTRPPTLSVHSGSVSDMTPPPRTDRAMILLVAVLAGVSSAILCIVLYLEMRPNRPSPAKPSPTAAPPIPLAQFTVQAAPADARILLDDTPLPANPYAAELPMDGRSHRVRVEAAGYVPQTHLVTLDRPTQTLRVNLVRAR